MDKNQIRKFSQYARSILIPEMEQTISIWKKANIVPGGVQIGNHSYNDSLSLKYSSAVTSLKKQIDKKGEKALAEEAAYIWFNRIVALRFMEVNKYLPTRSSLFASDDDTGIPEIVKNIDSEWNSCGCDKNAIDQYIGKYDVQSIQELYGLILVSICNKLSEHYGFMFSKIDDWTALLFPRTILNASHILRDKNNGMLNIVDEDWREVEVIGWIYQDYISEEKNKLINASREKNRKFGKKEIGAVTQLFTPRWIVEYMVQNTVGKLWLLNHPNNNLQMKWKFYIDCGESDFEKISVPEELKLLDPACGSGHILVVGFDVLFEIYKAAGYMDEDIPELIIKNNLYGFEIDERAHQLACFAILMKAKQYDKNIEKKVNIGDHIICIEENNNFTQLDENKYPNLRNFINLWYNGKIYGSLMEMDDVKLDEEILIKEYVKFKTELGLFSDSIIDENQLGSLLNQFKLFTQKYNVIVTNPPYMGSTNMDNNLRTFIQNNYSIFKADLFSAFINKCVNITKNGGFLGMLTPYVWMFIATYEEMRNRLYENIDITSLIQLEYNAFEAACVPVATFIFNKTKKHNVGSYIRLSDFKGSDNQAPRVLNAINNKNCNYFFKNKIDNYNLIPGHPVAYWASENFIKAFNSENKRFSDYGDIKAGIMTGDDSKFLKLWYEVDFTKIGICCTKIDYLNDKYKWYPLNKGGNFRRWYGNFEYIVNLENKGYDIINSGGNYRLRDDNYYFKKGITRSELTSGKYSARLSDNGSLFGSSGPMAFPNMEHEDGLYLLGLLNSKVAQYVFDVINPTIHYNVSCISSLPVLSNNTGNEIVNLVKENIELSKKDWNSFETSRCFKRHPLIFGDNIKDSMNIYTTKTNSNFKQIKINEERLNSLYIDIYSMQNELSPDVIEDYITIHIANRRKDTQSLLSYIIGCIMGRYSLDHEGLIYAGGEFDKSKYKTFKVDDDGIIPILDKDYSDDDIVERTKEFVKKVWGESTLDENLNWIAESLEPESNKTADQVIRDYYNKEFYDNHCQIYQKRPIYWLFVSNPAKPKDSAFKALVYMHRYSETTIQDLRRNYVQNYQQKLLEERARIENNNDKASQKRVAEIDKINTELTAYANKLKDFAETHQGTIDLDDGVKINYGMFMDAGIVAKIKL